VKYHGTGAKATSLTFGAERLLPFNVKVSYLMNCVYVSHHRRSSAKEAEWTVVCKELDEDRNDASKGESAGVFHTKRKALP
jgi:hypothetical protein